jgi:hypothetical protein
MILIHNCRWRVILIILIFKSVLFLLNIFIQQIYLHDVYVIKETHVCRCPNNCTLTFGNIIFKNGMKDTKVIALQWKS